MVDNEIIRYFYVSGKYEDNWIYLFSENNAISKIRKENLGILYSYLSLMLLEIEDIDEVVKKYGTDFRKVGYLRTFNTISNLLVEHGLTENYVNRYDSIKEKMDLEDLQEVNKLLSDAVLSGLVRLEYDGRNPLYLERKSLILKSKKQESETLDSVGSWYLAHIEDTGIDNYYSGEITCSLGHNLRYLFIARNDVSNEEVAFGSTCANDFFQITDKESNFFEDIISLLNMNNNMYYYQNLLGVDSITEQGYIFLQTLIENKSEELNDELFILINKVLELKEKNILVPYLIARSLSDMVYDEYIKEVHYISKYTDKLYDEVILDRYLFNLMFLTHQYEGKDMAGLKIPYYDVKYRENNFLKQNDKRNKDVTNDLVFSSNENRLFSSRNYKSYVDFWGNLDTFSLRIYLIANMLKSEHFKNVANFKTGVDYNPINLLTPLNMLEELNDFNKLLNIRPGRLILNRENREKVYYQHFLTYAVLSNNYIQGQWFKYVDMFLNDEIKTRNGRVFHKDLLEKENLDIVTLNLLSILATTKYYNMFASNLEPKNTEYIQEVLSDTDKEQMFFEKWCDFDDKGVLKYTGENYLEVDNVFLMLIDSIDSIKANSTEDEEINNLNNIKSFMVLIYATLLNVIVSRETIETIDAVLFDKNNKEKISLEEVQTIIENNLTEFEVVNYLILKELLNSLSNIVNVETENIHLEYLEQNVNYIMENFRKKYMYNFYKEFLIKQNRLTTNKSKPKKFIKSLIYSKDRDKILNRLGKNEYLRDEIIELFELLGHYEEYVYYYDGIEDYSEKMNFFIENLVINTFSEETYNFFKQQYKSSVELADVGDMDKTLVDLIKKEIPNISSVKPKLKTIFNSWLDFDSNKVYPIETLEDLIIINPILDSLFSTPENSKNIILGVSNPVDIEKHYMNINNFLNSKKDENLNVDLRYEYPQIYKDVKILESIRNSKMYTLTLKKVKQISEYKAFNLKEMSYITLYTLSAETVLDESDGFIAPMIKDILNKNGFKSNDFKFKITYNISDTVSKYISYQTNNKKVESKNENITLFTFSKKQKDIINKNFWNKDIRFNELKKYVSK